MRPLSLRSDERILDSQDRVSQAWRSTGEVMNGRRILSLVLLAVWGLFGPMAIAFGDCAAAAASCHLICTPIACPAPVPAMTPEAVAALVPQPEPVPVTIGLCTHEPPPKSPLSAA